VNEKNLAMGIAKMKANFKGVEWKYVKEIRLIVLNKPTSLDDIAGGGSCKSDIHRFNHLAQEILLPLIMRARVPVTTYLLRPFEPGRLDILKQILKARYDQLYQYSTTAHDPLRLGGQTGGVGEPVVHAVKTLNEYIEEGWEDELLAEELQYWREEYKRRKDLTKADAEKGQELNVGSEGEPVLI
jgi:hypothetical protein